MITHVACIKIFRLFSTSINNSCTNRTQYLTFIREVQCKILPNGTSLCLTQHFLMSRDSCQQIFCDGRTGDKSFSTRFYPNIPLLSYQTSNYQSSRYQEGLNTDTDLHENCLYRHRYDTDLIIGGTLPKITETILSMNYVHTHHL